MEIIDKMLQTDVSILFLEGQGIQDAYNIMLYDKNGWFPHVSLIRAPQFM